MIVSCHITVPRKHEISQVGKIQNRKNQTQRQFQSGTSKNG